MIKAKKVRLYPTEEQEQKMWQSVGTARFIYNWTLAKQQENYKQGGKFISDNDLRKQITRLKKSDLAWLSEVSNNVAKQAVKDGCDAYKRFFALQKRTGIKFTKETLVKCIRQNRVPGLTDMNGYPKFKSRKKAKPSFYNDTSKLKVNSKTVLLEKIGWVKIKPNQIPTPPCKYINPRISHDGKYWYLSVGIDQEQPCVELTGESIGIDIGVKDLAICSNGMVFKNINKIRVIKQLEKRLRRLQRKVSHKYQQNKNGKEHVKTSNIIKLERQIKLLHRRLANIRSNYLHQSTNRIVKTKPSRIVMETLNIKGMMKNRHLSKAIAQQCLYEFKRQIQYKCEWYGIQFVEADKWFASSKICSKCGNKKVKLSLSERIYTCDCGLVIDRDYNASINLSRYELA